MAHNTPKRGQPGRCPKEISVYFYLGACTTQLEPLPPAQYPRHPARYVILFFPALRFRSLASHGVGSDFVLVSGARAACPSLLAAWRLLLLLFATHAAASLSFSALMFFSSFLLLPSHLALLRLCKSVGELAKGAYNRTERSATRDRASMRRSTTGATGEVAASLGSQAERKHGYGFVRQQGH